VPKNSSATIKLAIFQSQSGLSRMQLSPRQKEKLFSNWLYLCVLFAERAAFKNVNTQNKRVRWCINNMHIAASAATPLFERAAWGIRTRLQSAQAHTQSIPNALSSNTKSNISFCIFSAICSEPK